MRYTQIIPEFAGYYWEWTNQQQWAMRWEPVQGFYSPPRLDHHLQYVMVEVSQDLQENMGRVIGKNGYYFKYITQWSGAVYIFYRDDLKCIEIWGNQDAITRANRLLECHFQDVRMSFAK